MIHGSIENTCSIDMRVSLKAGAIHTNWLEQHRDRDPQHALTELIKTLEALGFKVERNKSQLHIEFPEASEALRLRKRGGGRPHKEMPKPDPMCEERSEEENRLIDEFRCLQSDTERVAWVQEHGIDKAAIALGVSTSTVYRRLAGWKKNVPLEAHRDEYLSIEDIDEKLAWLRKQSTPVIRFALDKPYSQSSRDDLIHYEGLRLRSAAQEAAKSEQPVE